MKTLFHLSIYPQRSLPRFTIHGKILLWTSALMLAIGIARVDEMIVYLTLLTLFSLVPMALVNWYNLKGLSVTSDSKDSIFAGQTYESVFTVANSKSMGSFALKIVSSIGNTLTTSFNEFHLKAWQTQRIRTLIHPLTRGHYEKHVFRLRTVFPFGVFGIEYPITLFPSLTIYPKPELPNGFESIMRDRDALLGSESQFEMDNFDGLREFRSGDSLKLIHWKATARRQKLIITKYKGAPQQRMRFHIIFWSGSESLLPSSDSFEKSLQHLTGIFLALNKRLIPFQFTASFLEWEMITHDPQKPALETLLTHLASAQQPPPDRIEDLHRQIRHIHPDCQPLIVSNSALASWSYRIRVTGKSCLCFDNTQCSVIKGS